jgi:hypothetical protein
LPAAAAPVVAQQTVITRSTRPRPALALFIVRFLSIH